MTHSLARRRFLKWSAAAAVGASFFDAAQGLQAAGLLKDEDPYRGFPIGAQSYSLRNYNLLEAARHLQGMGVHYVELYKKHLNPASTKAEIKEVLSVLQDAELKLAAHGVNNFSNDHEANRKVFEFAKAAGIKNITANPKYDSFDSLDKLVAEYNIRIAIHNHGPGALYDTIESVQKVVKDRHPLIGACVDTGHFIRSKVDPVKAIYELGPRVFGVHIKDEEKREKASKNVIIGTGFLDLVGMFTALKKVNFPADGSISLEYEANPENPLDDMKLCFAKAREAIAKVAL